LSQDSLNFISDLQKAVSDFNETAFFECHEILEDLWRPMPSTWPLKRFLQGWIQVAVGFHHWQQNNATGAHNLLDSGLFKLKENVDQLPNDWPLSAYGWYRLIEDVEVQLSILQRLKLQGFEKGCQLPLCFFPKLS
jgi:Domain of unknown function (DUF309)